MSYRDSPRRSRTWLFRSSRKGFTLIELLVCLVIIMIITLITRSSKTQYERSIFLSNQAYDIALAIREAQAYAINVRCSSSTGCSTGGGSFDIGYGVRFTTGANFKLFADLDNDHFYDGLSEQVRDYTIKNGNTISSICVVPVANQATCTSVTTLDATFRRPDSETCLNSTGAGLSGDKKATPACVTYAGISEARVTLQASNGATKVIRIYSSGQISVP